MLNVFLLFPLGEAIAGTTITNIAQCKELNIKAETDLKRTLAIEIYVDYPTQYIIYNEYVVQSDKVKGLLNISQSGLPTTTLNLKTRKATFALKEVSSKIFSDCHFDKIGISVLKRMAAKHKK